MGGMELRIPEGYYDTMWHYTDKYKDVLKLHSVHVSAGRAILIHSGNAPIDTEGCLVAGRSYSNDSVTAPSRDKISNIANFVKSLHDGRYPLPDDDLSITVIIKNKF